jgi:hypothetical protein
MVCASFVRSDVLDGLVLSRDGLDLINIPDRKGLLLRYMY